MVNFKKILPVFDSAVNSQQTLSYLWYFPPKLKHIVTVPCKSWVFMFDRFPVITGDDMSVYKL